MQFTLGAVYMRKQGKKLRVIQDKEQQENRFVIRGRICLAIGMILAGALLTFVLFVGWQRGMAEEGESKWAREKAISTPSHSSAYEINLAKILNRENNEMIKIVTENTKNEVK